MIRKLLIMAVLFAITVFYGCGRDQYSAVPPKTESVLFTRPYIGVFDIDRDTGGKVEKEPLLPGNRNHGNGPAVRYDFDMNPKTKNLKLAVKTTDNLNLPVTVSCTYVIRPGKSKEAALNYLPSDKLTADGTNFELGAKNAIQVVRVPIEEIFERNVTSMFELASQDVISGYTCDTIQQDVIKAKIREKLKKLMDKYATPRILVVDGKPKINPPKILSVAGKQQVKFENMISISEVIEVKSINIESMAIPNALTNSITNIEKTRAKIQASNEVLKRKENEEATKIANAENTIAQNNNIRLAVEKNPAMLTLQKLTKIKKGVQDGRNRNTRVFFVPQGYGEHLRLDASGSVTPQGKK